MKRITPACAVLLLLAVFSGPTVRAQTPPGNLPPEVLAYPELILFNGQVLTVDESFSRQEALAVRGQRILAVGSDSRILRMAGPGTRRLDLEGRTVLPGFIDTHLHLGDYSMDRMLLEEKGIEWEGRIERIGIVWEDREMALRDIRRAVAAASAGEWILIPTREGERILRTITPSELDQISPSNPVVFKDVSRGGRPAAVNGRGVEAAGLPAAGRPAGNVLVTGPAAALLAEHLIWAIPQERIIPWQRKGMELANRWGLTTVVTRIKPEQFTALRSLWLEGNLSVRWRVSFPGPLRVSRTGNLSDIGDDWLRISGATGGAVPGSDAALEHWSSRVPPAAADLADWPVRRQQFLEAVRHGWSVPNTHIKGDVAVHEVLDLFQEGRQHPVVRSPNQRLTMDHMQEIDERDLARIRELGVIPSSQMIDLFCDEHPKGSSDYAAVFGADHVNRMLPIRSYLEQGIRPTVEGDSGDDKHGRPLWAIEKLVCRCVDGASRIWGPDQRISRQDALRMKTIWAAGYSGDQERLGSLEPGKLADLVVLDGDYLRVPEEEISEIQVVLTVTGGRVVFSRLESVTAGEPRR